MNIERHMQPGLRAFQYFDEVPPGHCLYRVDTDRHEPHLHRGEFVVVDTTDREIAPGELFIVLLSRGPDIWQIIERRNFPFAEHAHAGKTAYFICPLQHVGRWADGSRRLYLSDGPYFADHLRRDLLGRVVGIFDPRERFERTLKAAPPSVEIPPRRAQR